MVASAPVRIVVALLLLVWLATAGPLQAAASLEGSRSSSFSSFGLGAGTDQRASVTASWAHEQSTIGASRDPWAGRSIGSMADSITKDGWWERRTGRGEAKTPESATITKIARKLAVLRVTRQEMAKSGSSARELARMDARIDGFERLRDLLSRRQLLVKAGRPPSEVAAVDSKIVYVRDLLRKIAAEESDGRKTAGTRWQQTAPAQPWRNPFGSYATGDAGSLRRSMGL